MSQSAELFFIPYDTESKSRNADFISIAAERQSATLGAKGPVKLKNPWAEGPSILRTFFHNPSTQPAAEPRPFFYLRRSRHHHPLNPLNLLNPLNPHAAGVSIGCPKSSSSRLCLFFPDCPSWYPGSFHCPALPGWTGFRRWRRLRWPGCGPRRDPSFLR